MKISRSIKIVAIPKNLNGVRNMTERDHHGTYSEICISKIVMLLTVRYAYQRLWYVWFLNENLDVKKIVSHGFHRKSRIILHHDNANSHTAP